MKSRQNRLRTFRLQLQFSVIIARLLALSVAGFAPFDAVSPRPFSRTFHDPKPSCPADFAPAKQEPDFATLQAMPDVPLGDLEMTLFAKVTDLLPAQNQG